MPKTRNALQKVVIGSSPVIPAYFPLVDDWQLNERLSYHERHEHRIYLDEKLDLYAIVDEADYSWLVQWRWTKKQSHRDRLAGKVYARRAKNHYSEGVLLKTYTIYMHVEIMKRTGIEPPCPKHSLVDHLNGNSLDCRRLNLRWATSSMNNKNVFGKASRQMGLQL